MLDEAIHHGHAEAAAHAELLGREERFEDPGERLRIHAGAVVGHRDPDIFAGLDLEIDGGRALDLLDGTVDHQRAAVGHRILGVEHEVEQRAFELMGVGLDDQVTFGRRGQQRDAAGQRATDQLGHAQHQLIDVDGTRIHRLLPREGEQALDQFGAATGGLERRIDVLLDQCAVRQAIAQSRQIAHDDGQHVVEVVGQTAGELPDRLELLRLRQREMGAPLLGDIHRMDVAALHLAVGTNVGQQRAACIDGGAGRRDQRIFVGHLLAGQRAPYVLLDQREHGGPDHLANRPVDDALGGPAEPARVALVGIAVGPAVVEIGDMGWDRVGDLAQAPFRVLQRRGDVPVGLDRCGQFGIGPGELGRAVLDVILEFGLVAGQPLALALLLGDVGIQRDEAAVGQRKTPDRQQPPVRPQAQGLVHRERPRRGNPRGNLLVGIARAVLAAFRVVANELFEMGPRFRQFVREIEQFEKRAVAGDQAQLAVDHGDALIEQVQAGRHHFAIQAIADLHLLDLRKS